MGLASELVGAYFDDSVMLGLAEGSAELPARSGYRRTGANWSIDGASALGVARFGPFLDAVAFDTALVVRDGAVVDAIALAGETRLPPGSEHTCEVVIAVAEAD